jgi:hypothetical protein
MRQRHTQPCSVYGIHHSAAEHPTHSAALTEGAKLMEVAKLTEKESYG